MSLGLGRRFCLAAKDKSSMAINFSKISRSLLGLSVAGSRQPRIQALFSISGFLPFQYPPKPVSVFPFPAICSL